MDKFLLSLGIILIVLGYSLIHRSQKILKFRNKIVNDCMNWEHQNPKDKIWAKNLFTNLPSYWVMLFKCWKPLEISEWLTKEKIQKLYENE